MAHPAQQIYNPIRIWEFIICVICFGLSVSTFAKDVLLNEVIKSILFIVPTAYCLLTIVDIIVISASKPFLWTSWIPLALVAVIMFSLSTGFLIFAKETIGPVLYELTLVAYIMGGVIFLSDIINILRQLQLLPQVEIKNKIANDTCSYKMCPTHSGRSRVEFDNESEQVEIEIFKNTCSEKQTAETKKVYRTAVPSHGGTFHVSTSIVPISTVAKKFNTACIEPWESTDGSTVDGCICEETVQQDVAVGETSKKSNSTNTIARKHSITSNCPSDCSCSCYSEIFKNRLSGGCHRWEILSPVEEMSGNSSDKSKGGSYAVDHWSTSSSSNQKSTMSCAYRQREPTREESYLHANQKPDLKRRFQEHIRFKNADNEWEELSSGDIYTINPDFLSPRSVYERESPACLGKVTHIPKPGSNTGSAEQSTILPGTVERYHELQCLSDTIDVTRCRMLHSEPETSSSARRKPSVDSKRKEVRECRYKRDTGTVSNQRRYMSTRRCSLM